MGENKLNTNELFNRITNLSNEAEWTQEETREALSEAGVNPENFAERTLKLIAGLKKQSPFYWKTRAHAIRDSLLERVRLKVSSETIGLSRHELLGRLNEAIEHLPLPIASRYGVAFRKFEDASEEDIRTMLEEIAVIEDLEQDKS
jgi:hypothetical protein